MCQYLLPEFLPGFKNPGSLTQPECLPGYATKTAHKTSARNTQQKKAPGCFGISGCTHLEHTCTNVADIVRHRRTRVSESKRTTICETAGSLFLRTLRHNSFLRFSYNLLKSLGIFFPIVYNEHHRVFLPFRAAPFKFLT